ncbi:hypothetical protein VTI74DRAFT_5688 [Chaetomium olivicolor]
MLIQAGWWGQVMATAGPGLVRGLSETQFKALPRLATWGRPLGIKLASSRPSSASYCSHHLGRDPPDIRIFPRFRLLSCPTPAIYHLDSLCSIPRLGGVENSTSQPHSQSACYWGVLHFPWRPAVSCSSWRYTPLSQGSWWCRYHSRISSDKKRGTNRCSQHVAAIFFTKDDAEGDCARSRKWPDSRGQYGPIHRSSWRVIDQYNFTEPNRCA